jgi:hypothetical protein
MNERTEIWLRFFLYKIFELVGIGIVSIGAYYIGWLMNTWLPEGYQVTGWFILWFTGLFGLLMIILAVGLIMIWIIKNWEIATEHTKTHNKDPKKKKK